MRDGPCSTSPVCAGPVRAARGGGRGARRWGSVGSLPARGGRRSRGARGVGGSLTPGRSWRPLVARAGSRTRPSSSPGRRSAPEPRGHVVFEGAPARTGIVGGGVAPPSPRCERGVLLLDEPTACPREGSHLRPPARQAGALLIELRERIDRAGGSCTHDLGSPRPARCWLRYGSLLRDPGGRARTCFHAVHGRAPRLLRHHREISPGGNAPPSPLHQSGVLTSLLRAAMETPGVAPGTRACDARVILLSPRPHEIPWAAPAAPPTESRLAAAPTSDGGRNHPQAAYGSRTRPSRLAPSRSTPEPRPRSRIPGRSPPRSAPGAPAGLALRIPLFSCPASPDTKTAESGWRRRESHPDLEPAELA